VFTDQTLSSRVKSLSIGNIKGLNTSIEIWDLKRLKDLDESFSDYEEFTVDAAALGEPIKVLPANISNTGVSTYLGIMPATLLSAIYDAFGQRLLESNVRTFLDFRAGTNKGMRKTLVTEPENFFSYNNGLTVTSTSIKSSTIDGQLVITELDNMQIVNGGQTTAAIYFSPRDKGSVKGLDKEYQFKDIDLSKVYIQMKLSVIGDKESADVIKANIATFANSQNSIQLSDLVSNHPFHLKIETRSRKQLMPAGESGMPTKWFYERSRGQYSTSLRALNGVQKKSFEASYPKKQMFSKTDMAKYENTWRMRPHIVKKGAQANLKAFGTEIIKEFEKNEDEFGPVFFNDLVAKMILFRTTDMSILKSQWYQNDKGFKAEATTFTLALLRHALLKAGKDINLSRIFQNQAVSSSLIDFIVTLAKRVKNNVTDPVFREGVANPSEFCKSEKGWEKVQDMDVNICGLDDADLLDAAQIIENKQETKEVNSAYETVSDFDYIMARSSEEWMLISEFNVKKYGYGHANVAVPRACANLITSGKVPTDKQMRKASQILEKTYEEGFEFFS
jgi:hypothetical protein